MVITERHERAGRDFNNDNGVIQVDLRPAATNISNKILEQINEILFLITLWSFKFGFIVISMYEVFHCKSSSFQTWLGDFHCFEKLIIWRKKNLSERAESRFFLLIFGQNYCGLNKTFCALDQHTFTDILDWQPKKANQISFNRIFGTLVWRVHFKNQCIFYWTYKGLR